MRCFNVRSSWAASPEGFSMQGETGIKHKIPPKGRNSPFWKEESRNRGLLDKSDVCCFPRDRSKPSSWVKGHLDLTRIFLTASADELWINFRKCLASELVLYPECDELSRGLCGSPPRYDCAELIKPKQLRSLSELSGAEITIVVETLNGGAPCPPGSPGPSLLLLYSLISVLLKKWLFYLEEVSLE